MRNPKPYILGLLFLGFAGVAYAAPSFVFQRTILPEVDSYYELGTSTRAWLRVFSDTFCLTSDTCITSWPTGAGTSTDPFMATYFVATSSSRASIFPLASTTALSVSGNFYPPLGIWNSSGNVGIGQTSPANKLEVNGNVSLATSGFLGFVGNTAVTAANYSLFGNTTLTLLNARAGASIGFRIANTDVANFSTTGGFGFGSTYYNLDPGQNNMIVEGNLGVGVSTPTYKLDVAGLGHFTGLVDASHFIATSSTASQLPYASTTALTVSGTSYLGTVASGVWNGTAIDVSSFTNLTAGDGLTLTDDDLDCDTASGSVFGCLSAADWTTFNTKLDGSGSARALTVWNDAGTGLTATSSNPLYVGALVATTTTVSSFVGNVGIGTTSPSGELHVADPTGVANLTIEANSANESRLTFRTLDGTTNTFRYSWPNDRYEWFIGSSNVMDLDANGDLGVGTSTPWGKLSVTNTGTDPSFIVEDSVSPDTSPFVINASGNVGIGAISPLGKLSVETDGASNDIFSAVYGAGFNAGLNFYSTNGTQASPTANSNGQPLGLIRFQGFDTARSSGALITATTSAEWGTAGDASDNPTDLQFFTAADGAAISATPRMVITSTGNIGIATTTPPAALTVVPTSGGTAQQIFRNAASNVTLQITNLAGNWHQGVNNFGDYGFRFNNGAINGSNAFLIASTSAIGIATSTPAFTLDVFGSARIDPAGQLIIPVSSNPTLSNDGAIAADTTSNQLKYRSGAATRVLAPGISNAFVYATSTMGTGSTTIKVSGYSQATTFTKLGCNLRGTGRFVVQMGDGTASTTAVASSNGLTTTFTTLASNNAFTAGEAILFQIGSATGVVADPSCSYERTIDAD